MSASISPLLAIGVTVFASSPSRAAALIFANVDKRPGVGNPSILMFERGKRARTLERRTWRFPINPNPGTSLPGSNENKPSKKETAHDRKIRQKQVF